MLAAIRYQRYAEAPPPANEPEEVAAADQQRQGSVGKRVFLADSADGGRTWTGFRPVKREDAATTDIVFGESASQSRPGGQTWAPEAYRLRPGHGYAASVVLADDTIVTALGNTPLNQKGSSIDGKWYAQVVRWRLVSHQ